VYSTRRSTGAGSTAAITEESNQRLTKEAATSLRRFLHEGGSPYRSGRYKDWLKFKNPDAPAVKREAEEDWGKESWR
jgi:hypothetical protein